MRTVLDIIEIEAPGNYVQRDEGLYLSVRHGRITWSEGGGVWQDTGATVCLMDGPTLLAVSEAIIPSWGEAKEYWDRKAEGITPWARVLRSLRPLDSLRSQVESLEAARRFLLDDPHGHDPYYVASIEACALPEDVEAGRADVPGLPATLGLPPVPPEAAQLWAAVGAHVLRRLRRTIDDYLRVALTLAPDLEAHGEALSGWEVHHPPHDSESVAPMVAEELLAAWAVVNGQRDPLVRWAVRKAEVSKARTHEVSGLSRSTIDRLLS
jgi:hypothetical protein